MRLHVYFNELIISKKFLLNVYFNKRKNIYADKYIEAQKFDANLYDVHKSINKDLIIQFFKREKTK